MRLVAACTMVSFWMLACHGILSTSAPAVSAIYVSAPALGQSGVVVIDSATLRPASSTGTPSVDFVTTFQNGRYHPETVRALSEDSSVLAAAAGMIVSRGTPQPVIFLDFQDMAPDDLHQLAGLLRGVTALARSESHSAVALLVPPQDTLSYPTQVLSRVVDLLVVRAYGAHRPGTGPGAPTTAEFITRALGLRAVVVGPARVVADLPLFGYRWEHDGTARPVSYEAVSRALTEEAGAFRRDPATQFLVANGRSGWVAWVPDGRTIEYLISIVRRSSVSAIVLEGAIDTAPDIQDHVTAALRR